MANFCNSLSIPRNIQKQQKLVVLLLATACLIYLIGTLRINDSKPAPVITLTPRPGATTFDTWRAESKNEGAPYLKCDAKSKICTLDNLCYWQHRDRTKYNFFTIGRTDMNVWTKDNYLGGLLPEFVRDVEKPTHLLWNDPILKEREFYRLKGTTFLFGRKYNPNIFHFSQKLLPLYDIIRNYADEFPVIRRVLFLTVNSMNEWQKGNYEMVKQLYQKTVRILSKETSYPGWEEVHVHDGFDGNFSPNQETFICMDKIIFPFLSDDTDKGPDLTPRKWPLYIDSRAADSFRRDAYTHIINTSPPTDIPPVITIISRSTQTRVIEGEEEFLRNIELIAAQFGLRVRTAKLEQLSLAEQVGIMRNTGLLMGIHGAGLTNLIYLPKTAGVLELFPFKTHSFRQNSYSIPAKVFGLQYHYWMPTDLSEVSFSPILDPAVLENKLKECDAFRRDDPRGSLLPGHCQVWYQANSGIKPSKSLYDSLRKVLVELFVQRQTN